MLKRIDLLLDSVKSCGTISWNWLNTNRQKLTFKPSSPLTVFDSQVRNDDDRLAYITARHDAALSTMAGL